MTHISADRGACEGYGNCVQAAPTLFALGDDDLVKVMANTVSELDSALARQAALACPVAAITVED